MATWKNAKSTGGQLNVFFSQNDVTAAVTRFEKWRHGRMPSRLEVIFRYFSSKIALRGSKKDVRDA